MPNLHPTLTALFAGIATLAAAPPSPSQTTQPASNWTATTLTGDRRPLAPGQPFDQSLLRITHPAPPQPTAQLTLLLRDGQRIPGAADSSSTGDTVAWRHRSLGTFKIPIASIVGVERLGLSPAPQNPSPPSTGAIAAQDLLLLVNGDRQAGLVTAMDADGVSLQPQTGDPVKIPWSTVARVSLADVTGGTPKTDGAPKTEDPPRYVLSLSDGAVISASNINLEPASVRLQLAAEVSLPSAEIASIERVGGGAWSLPLLPLLELRQSPYLSIVRPPLTTIDPATGQRRWSLTAFTSMKYRVPPGASRLTLAYSLDPSASHGAATLRVISGSTVLHEGPATAVATPLDLKVDPATPIDIEVGFGDSPGVQSRVRILEPLFLK